MTIPGFASLAYAPLLPMLSSIPVFAMGYCRWMKSCIGSEPDLVLKIVSEERNETRARMKGKSMGRNGRPTAYFIPKELPQLTLGIPVHSHMSHSDSCLGMSSSDARSQSCCSARESAENGFVPAFLATGEKICSRHRLSG